MTKQSKILAGFAIVAVLVLGSGMFRLLDNTYHLTGGHGEVVDALIARNIAARGGAEAWRSVSSLKLSGLLDLGHGMYVPYVLLQKRPAKMCLEFVFDEETAIQCVDGDSGWKLLPFRGHKTPEAMNELELREMADMADLDGLLLDSARRGHKVELVSREQVNGRPADKLQVTLPGGARRWVYLDVETALELKLESTRLLRGKERTVETFYSNWQETDGILIPRRQLTQTQGDKEAHFLVVELAVVNPPLQDTRFAMAVASGPI